MPGTLAVDSDSETFWVLCKDGGLKSYTITGRLRTSTQLGSPANAALVALDSRFRRLWVAAGKSLWLLDPKGSSLSAACLDGRPMAMTLDRRNSRLWLVTSRSVTIFRDDGTSLMRIRNDGRIRGLAYDLDCDRLWVVGASFIRPQAEGSARDLRHPVLPSISCDGSGGAWIASPRQLSHVDIDGRTLLVDACFAATERITSLVADPGDRSAWVATNRRMLHYFASGTLRAQFHSADPVESITLPIPPVPPEIRAIEPTKVEAFFDRRGIAAILNGAASQSRSVSEASTISIQ